MGTFGKKVVFEAMVMDEMVEKISEQEDERIQIRIGLLGKPTFLRWAKKEKQPGRQMNTLAGESE